jgi:glutathione S-transferase
MWAVAEMGVPHERIDAGGAFGKTDTAEYAAMNPNKLVPVLDDDGFILWESNAIVRYLSETYGRGTLASQDRKQFARADQWMEWNATSIQPEVIATLFWGLIRTPAAERNLAGIEASAKRVGERFKLLDAHLKDRAFIGGTRLTMADIPAGAMMYRYFTLPVERPSLPNVEAWYGRLTERAPYRDHVMIDYASLKVVGA